MIQESDKQNTTKVIDVIIIKKIDLIIITYKIVTKYTSVYLNFDVLCHSQY